MQHISKEDFIVLIIFAIFALLIPVVIIARHFFELDPLAWLHIDWGRVFVGYVFLGLATLTCLFNAYIALYIPWAYKREHGSMKDFASMSGLPLLGSIFVFCAAALLPVSVPMGIFLLLLYVLDGNGLPCFFLAVIRSGL